MAEDQTPKKKMGFFKRATLLGVAGAGAGGWLGHGNEQQLKKQLDEAEQNGQPVSAEVAAHHTREAEDHTTNLMAAGLLLGVGAAAAEKAAHKGVKNWQSHAPKKKVPHFGHPDNPRTEEEYRYYQRQRQNEERERERER